MSDPAQLAHEFAQAESSLLSRWPENKVAPDLGRISALMDLLGEPQRSAPVIHIAGTNGKTSTARMIETLLRTFGLSTGLFTSPSLDCITERVQINGKPVTREKFVEAYRDIEPYLVLIDRESETAGGPPVTMFEAMTALAFACFADTPVDVMVIECGMGGTWDATNVVSPAVTVITPIGLDHMEYLGDTIEQIAAEKAGILAERVPAVMARQEAEVAAVLMRHCAALSAIPVREGVEFALLERRLALGGQQFSVQGLGGEYNEIYLSLHGEHQAANAAVALAAVESFLGASQVVSLVEGEAIDVGEALDVDVMDESDSYVENSYAEEPIIEVESGEADADDQVKPQLPRSRQLNVDTVREGFAGVTSPARMERVRTGPTVIVDAAHNPHGAAATAAALVESFDFEEIVAVVAVLEGKDAAGLLAALEPAVTTIIATRNSSPRSMSAEALGEIAAAVFGEERVEIAPTLPAGIERAIAIADSAPTLGTTGIVALGSVITAADARRLLIRQSAETPDDLSEFDDHGRSDDRAQDDYRDQDE